MARVLTGPDRFGTDAPWSHQLLQLGVRLPIFLSMIAAAVVVADGPSASELCVAAAFLALSLIALWNEPWLFATFHDRPFRVAAIAAAVSVLTWPGGGVASTFAALPGTVAGLGLVTAGRRGAVAAVLAVSGSAVANTAILAGHVEQSRLVNSVLGAILAPVVAVLLIAVPRDALIATVRRRSGASATPSEEARGPTADAGPSDAPCPGDELIRRAEAHGIAEVRNLERDELLAAYDALTIYRQGLLRALAQGGAVSQAARIVSIPEPRGLSGDEWEKLKLKRVEDGLRETQRQLGFDSMELKLLALGYTGLAAELLALEGPEGA